MADPNDGQIPVFQEIGTYVKVLPTDLNLSVEVYRAPEDGASPGNPKASAEVLVRTLAPGVLAFIDPLPWDTSALYWYRSRHVGGGYDPGPVTGWSLPSGGVKAALIPDDLPNVGGAPGSTGIVPVVEGGTGVNSWAAGALVAASAVDTFTTGIPSAAAGQVLQSQGVGVIPAWGTAIVTAENVGAGVFEAGTWTFDSSSRVKILSTDDVSLADGNAPLYIGADGGAHIEIDGNEIQAKANNTTAAGLNINVSGGTTYIGNTGTALLANTIVLSDGLVDLVDDGCAFQVSEGFNQSRIEFDPTGVIQSKNTDTTAAILSLNPLGADVTVGRTTGLPSGHGGQAFVAQGGLASMSDTVDGWAMVCFSSTAAMGQMASTHHRGSESSPAAVLDNDLLLDLAGYGAFSTDMVDISAGAYIRMRTTQNWSAGARGCEIGISTSPNGSTSPAEWALFTKDAKLQFIGNGAVPGAGQEGTIGKYGTTGLTLQGVTGSTYDLSLTDPTGAAVLNNPTGTRDVHVFGAIEWQVDSAGVNAPGIGRLATDGLTVKGYTGSSYDFVLTNGVSGTVFRVPTGTTEVTFLGDITLDTLGKFNSGATPKTDDVLRYNGTEWTPVDLLNQFNSGDVAANIVGATSVTFMNDGRNETGTPGSPAGLDPVLDVHYKSIIVDMGAYTLTNDPVGPPALVESYELEFSTTGGAPWTSLGADFTAPKVVHSQLDPAATYTYRFRIVAGSNSAWSNTAAGSPTDTPEVFADGIILASQISTTNLAAIKADLGVITAGWLGDADPGSASAAIRLSGSEALPTGGNAKYIDFTATGSNAFLEHPALTLEADTGQADFSGTVSATDFTGSTLLISGHAAIGSAVQTVTGVVLKVGDTDMASGERQMSIEGNFDADVAGGTYHGLNIEVDMDLNALAVGDFEQLLIDGSSVGITGSGSLTNYSHIRVNGLTGITPTITNEYGLYVNPIGEGATNYAIYTNAGLVRFGDDVTIASADLLFTGAASGLETAGGEIKNGAGGGTEWYPQSPSGSEYARIDHVASGTVGKLNVELYNDTPALGALLTLTGDAIMTWDGSVVLEPTSQTGTERTKIEMIGGTGGTAGLEIDVYDNGGTIRGNFNLRPYTTALATWDGIWTATGQPRVKCIRSGNQTGIANGVATAVAWNGTDVFDVGDMHNPSSNNTRITIPDNGDGVYAFTFHAQWNPNFQAGESYSCEIYKNGVATGHIMEDHGSGTGATHDTTQPHMTLTYIDEASDNGGGANDYYEIYVTQFSGVSDSLLATGAHFTAVKVA